MAGLKGGCGKTTLSLGLIAFYKQKGLDIVPFKKGPDYIDAGWLSCAAECPCYNLDAFLIGKDQIIPSFIAHSNNVHCAIIEGNRGLYDGMDEEGTYSTAELAKILKAPVLLIIDCTKTTRTVAAIVLGCQRFDPSVEIKGIILNQIAGSRHESVIKASINRYSDIPVVGAIPRLDEELFPERHMGLTPYQEHPEVEKAISAAKEITQRYLDLDAIWKIANEAPPLEITPPPITPPRWGRAREGVLKIGIIRDSAFQFYYPENLEELQKKGAELVEISPLSEKKLPEIDALYIGGGFPETHAIALAGNIDFRNDLRQAVEYGLPVYAECGGLMYLGESLIINNKTYPMVSIFPVKFSLEKKPQAHGYTMVEVGRPNPYYTSGIILKGHEFHYSRILTPPFNSPLSKGGYRGVYFAFRMKRGQGIIDKMDGLCYKNVLATYTHLHALGAREWVEGFINTAMFYRMNKSPITKLQ
jgi:cobyrinic acid a,c-diamide synthase